MSSITPLHRPTQLPGDGWLWDGQQWVWPGGPPCPPCPPQPGCGPPSCNSAIAKAQACYDQSQSLYNLVSQVVSDIFAKNPGIIPSPPPQAGSGPILGVTDGSNAQPGQVGEYILMEQTVPYAAYPNSTVSNISMGVLQPGDWQLMAAMQPSTNIGALQFSLNPVPAGASTGMSGSAFSADAGTPTLEYPVVVSYPARGNFTVPTLLAFQFQVVQGTDAALPAGTLYAFLNAWRVR